jgi:hypothetical protein
MMIQGVAPSGYALGPLPWNHAGFSMPTTNAPEAMQRNTLTMKRGALHVHGLHGFPASGTSNETNGLLPPHAPLLLSAHEAPPRSARVPHQSLRR